VNDENNQRVLGFADFWMIRIQLSSICPSAKSVVINFFVPTAELGWTPKQDHSSGFRKTVQWYLENPTWIANILNGNYQLERLGNQAP
jgi:hypothetical protein